MKWYWIVLIIAVSIIVGFAVSRATMKAQFKKKAADGLKKLKEKQAELDSELSGNNGSRLSAASRIELSGYITKIKELINSNDPILWAGIMDADAQCASVGKCWYGQACVRCRPVVGGGA